MIEEIKDYSVYTQRMSVTYADKSWWADFVPDNIDTIVDFGCADAGICEYIEERFPKRFKYIGVDCDEGMLKKAMERKEAKNLNAEFFSSLSDVKVENSKNTILILNSVIHELFSYLSKGEILSIVSSIDSIEPEYIAIRDMHFLTDETLLSDETITDFEKGFEEKFSRNYSQHKQFSGHKEGINFYVEFLLKYFYTENWDREVRERYLWNWTEELPFENYEKVHEEGFTIEYLRKKWEFDFNISTNLNTHKKILYKRK